MLVVGAAGSAVVVVATVSVSGLQPCWCAVGFKSTDGSLADAHYPSLTGDFVSISV